MLMNHKNFHLTQIPDKTNDNFLKKSKNPVFGYFSLMGNFSKKSGSVTCNYIWATNSMLRLRKKITSQFRQNLQKDGRMNRRTDTSYFPAEDGRPKNPQSKTGLLVSIRGHAHLIIAVLGL